MACRNVKLKSFSVAVQIASNFAVTEGYGASCMLWADVGKFVSGRSGVVRILRGHCKECNLLRR